MCAEYIVAVRGATTISCDIPDEITTKVAELMQKLLEQNKRSVSDIISIIFTTTDDIRSVNPATALRSDSRYRHTPLLCVQEAQYQGSIPLIIRVLLHIRCSTADTILKPLYMHGAKALRTDIAGHNNG